MGKWEMVRLGDVTNFNMGQSPSSESYNDMGEGLPFFQGKSDFGLMYPSVRMYCTDPKKTAKKNDILISVRAPVGTVNIATETCCIGRGLAAISQKESKSNYRYLYYYLQYKENDIASMGVGSTFKAISKKDLDIIKIPLPPLSIQKKIAEILDRASALIEKRKAQIEKLDLLVKSQFIEMFGDPVTNPMGWELSTLRGTSKRISDGPFGSNLKSEHYSADGIRVIRLQNIGVAAFLDDDKAFIPIDHYKKIKKHTCIAGDIVIGTLGEPNLRACIIPEYIEIAINKADCVHFVPDEIKVSSCFVCQYINQPAVLSLASSSIHGQTRSRISMSQVAALPIYMPPHSLQNQFTSFVEHVEAQKVKLKKSLDLLEFNYKSLMQKCFSGEVF